MNKFAKLLKGHKNVVFLDFEGTQFSAEIIAIGAVMATLGKNGEIKKMKEPFKIYVKAKNKIGKYVTGLTGITEEKIASEGVSFAKAMTAFKKYCGINFKKSSFVAFGNHDLVMLNKSCSYNFDYPTDVTSYMQKNFIDFMQFMSEFIKDDNGNPLSLVNACKLFNVEEAGVAHDPEIDAINLANLYNAFIKDGDTVLENYRKVLRRINHVPDPVAYVVKKLANGEDVTANEFESQLKEYLK